MRNLAFLASKAAWAAACLHQAAHLYSCIRACNQHAQPVVHITGNLECLQLSQQAHCCSVVPPAESLVLHQHYRQSGPPQTLQHAHCRHMVQHIEASGTLIASGQGRLPEMTQQRYSTTHVHPSHIQLRLREPKQLANKSKCTQWKSRGAQSPPVEEKRCTGCAICVLDTGPLDIPSMLQDIGKQHSR